MWYFSCFLWVEKVGLNKESANYSPGAKLNPSNVFGWQQTKKSFTFRVAERAISWHMKITWNSDFSAHTTHILLIIIYGCFCAKSRVDYCNRENTRSIRATSQKMKIHSSLAKLDMPVWNMSNSRHARAQILYIHKSNYVLQGYIATFLEPI